MTATEIRKEARKSLAGKWKQAVLITLFYALTTIIFNSSSNEENSFIYIFNIILELLNIFFTIPLILGFAFSFIKLKRGEKVGVFDFIKIGFENYKKSWGIFFAMLEKFVGVILLLVAAAVFFILQGIYMVAQTGAIPVFGTIGVILLIIAVICAYVKTLSLSLIYYIAYDEPNLKYSEIVNKSEELMKGKQESLFYLEISFIGWAILASATAGIGILWLVPYIQVSEICFYDNLIKK